MKNDAIGALRRKIDGPEFSDQPLREIISYLDGMRGSLLLHLPAGQPPNTWEAYLLHEEFCNESQAYREGSNEAKALLETMQQAAGQTVGSNWNIPEIVDLLVEAYVLLGRVYDDTMCERRSKWFENVQRIVTPELRHFDAQV